MKTESLGQFGAASNQQSVACAATRGVEKAIAFAQAGRLISAIKHIELANLGISREQAKAIVRSFGYDCALRWPEKEKGPFRCL